MHSFDANLLMPPPDSNLRLTKEEIALIDRWIEAGAEYEEHWAFIELPHHTPVPGDDGHTEIDRFLRAGWAVQDLEPAGKTNSEKWLRRVTFDLTGLPPSAAELEAFQTNGERKSVVQRLLSSPAYAERMTSEWLDVARYSDSYGYQRDHERYVWPWRDWVLRAFAKNKPYDEFVTEQLAGDLLSTPSQDQLLATTFNRLHGHCMEGGSILEEYRCEYVADRTETIGTAFLGLTFNCAKCHDHKYDPITAKDYYSLSSFFANIDESGLISYFTDAVPTPTMPLHDDSSRRALAEAKDEIQAILSRLKSPGETPPLPPTAAPSGSVAYLSFDSLGESLTLQNADAPDSPATTKAANALVTGYRGKGLQLTGDDETELPDVAHYDRHQPFSTSIWVKPKEHAPRANIYSRGGGADDAGSMGYELLLMDGKVTASLIHFWPGDALRIQTKVTIPEGEWTQLAVTYDGSSSASGLRIFINGTQAETTTIRDGLTRTITAYRGDHLTDRQSLQIGQRYRDRGFKGGIVDEFMIFERELSALEILHLHAPSAAASILAKAEPTAAEQSLIAEFARLTTHQDDLAALAAARKKYNDIVDATPAIMIMREMERPRQSYVLDRGAYDAKGEPVISDTPHFLMPFPEGAPRNRLGLAQWLTHPDHPLFARVTVNRYWQMLMGEGLVRTPEDFGVQGHRPEFPELLDWLARDFINSGFDLHHLISQIVLSDVYALSTTPAPGMRERDPENLYFARAHASRLPAEMIRDQALAVSGLLVDRLGGEPTKPYDVEVSFAPTDRDQGDGLYRRSVYHWWKRNAASPVLTGFDAPKRDICSVKREVTSSPLQSLILLNDPQMLEAARKLAAILLQQHGTDADAIVADAFLRLTSRQPSANEARILRKLYDDQLAEYTASPTDAASFLEIGDSPITSGIDPLPHATVAILVNTIMNLDDSLTKR